MSVSLTIRRPDQDVEIIPLGSYRGHKEGWAPLATELGLEMVPLFYGFFPVIPEYLDQLLGELAVFRRELIRLGAGYEERIEYVDQLTAALQRLKQSDGWRASIG